MSGFDSSPPRYHNHIDFHLHLKTFAISREPGHKATHNIAFQLNIVPAMSTLGRFKHGMTCSARLIINLGEGLSCLNLKLEKLCLASCIAGSDHGSTLTFKFSVWVLFTVFSQRHPCTNLILPCSCIPEAKKRTLFVLFIFNTEFHRNMCAPAEVRCLGFMAGGYPRIICPKAEIPDANQASVQHTVTTGQPEFTRPSESPRRSHDKLKPNLTVDSFPAHTTLEHSKHNSCFFALKAGTGKRRSLLCSPSYIGFFLSHLARPASAVRFLLQWKIENLAHSRGGRRLPVRYFVLCEATSWCVSRKRI